MTEFRGRSHLKAAGGAWSGAALQFVAGVILVRSLSQAAVGVFVVGSAIATVVFGVFDIRIEEGLSQFLIREGTTGRKESLRSALRYAVVVDVLSGVVILGFTVGGLLLLPLHLDSETQTVATIGALACFIGVADGSFGAVLYAQEAFGWISMYQFVSNAFRCLALVAVPINTPASAAWAMVLAQGATTGFVISIVLMKFTRNVNEERALTRTDRHWLLRFSAHVALSSAVATVRANATPLVLGGLGTHREVAGARVAESPTKLLGVSVAPLRTVLFPRLSRAWAHRDRGAARRLIRHYVGTTIVLGGSLGVLMIMAMEPLLHHIYGAAYGGFATAGRVFVVAALLDAIAGWQKVAPAALDRPWLRTLILLSEATALLIALVVLVPAYGATGAAASAVVAAAISLAMGAYWLRPALAESEWGDTGRRSFKEASGARRSH
jgi:O-antigen/teichoic acid export membrane protein